MSIATVSSNATTQMHVLRPTETLFDNNLINEELYAYCSTEVDNQYGAPIRFTAHILSIIAEYALNSTTNTNKPEATEKADEEENVKKWVDFNEKLQSNTNGKIPSPFEPVEKRTWHYLRYWL